MVQSRPSLAGGLHWVRGELDQSLARARGLIEQYMDAPEDQLPLQQAAVELHQVRGTAAMIQCVGVATLADEMKHSLQDLMQGRITEPETVYAALLGASVQLGDYIDALSSGAEDCVLVFQPVINELRLARGQGVLTDAELLAEHIRALGHRLPLPEGPNRREGAAQTSARKYLPAFQASLLQWLKSQDRELALGRMGKIADHLAAITTDGSVYQLWRVFAAAIESLLSDSMDEALEFKRLFGRVGQQIKLLGEQGEAAAAPGATALSYQFLYYIGRGKGVGPRTTLLRRAFGLDANLPSAERVDQLRNKIGGPNTQLLTRLAEEIRVDFSEVKDAIDLVVRAGAKAPDDLSKIVERLQRIGHTLNMLGLRTLEQVIGNQSKALAALGPEDTEASRKVWMDAATALLRVEHSLEGALFHQLHNPGGSKALQPEDEYEDRSPHSADLRDSISALLRESLVDLAKLKSHVDTFLKSGDASGLDQAPRMLNEVQSGLRILESERAADLCSDLRRYTLTEAFQNLNAAPGQADRFADAIACIEYYLEARQQRQPDADLILDDLQGYVSQLQFETDETSSDAVEGAAAVPSSPAVDEAALQVDPEIREVFLEEAGEVLGQLSGQMPLFRRDPEHPEALTEIRRAFHTLKGSGRMVGATTIGEFGWAIENLLNRCLDGSRPVSSPVVELVEQALNTLPVLVDKFRDAVPAEADAEPVISRAEALLKGDAAPAEPDMAEIFRNDAREHLAAVRTWLEGHPAGTDAPVEMDLIRHLHTVRGGAAVIEAEPIQQLAGALEEYLEGARAADLELDSAGLQLLDESTATLQGWIEQAGQPGAFGRGLAEPWLQRVAELQAAMPEHARAAVADRSLVDVFCNEALTLLQEIEQTSRHWQAHPDADQQAQRLQRQFQSLAAAANGANCEPMASAAQAFADRLPAVHPTEPFFDEFTGLLEELFGLLDDYRTGHLKSDGGQFAERIRSLGDSSETAGPETNRVTATPPVSELPMPPEPSEEGPDPELVAIFRGEAEEILEELDRQFDAWERDPASDLPLQEIARALHTLKGSARMAEQFDIGEVSHRLEGLLEQAASGGVPRNSALFALCHNVVDGLYHALEAIKREQEPDLQALLAELNDFGAGDTGSSAGADDSPAVVADAQSEPTVEDGASSADVSTEAHDSTPSDLHDPEAPASELTLDSGQMVEVAGSSADDVIEIDESLLADESLDDAGPAAETDANADADTGAVELGTADDAPAAETVEATELGAAAEAESESSAEDWTLQIDEADAPVSVDGLSMDEEDGAAVDVSGLEVADDEGIALSADDADESAAFPETGEPAEDAAASVTVDEVAEAELVEDSAPGNGSEGELSVAAEALESAIDEPEAEIATPQASSVADPSEAHAEADGDDGLERELVEIFSGEAAELLELMQSMLQRWTAEPTDQHAIAEMQRALHTFKGGARMAGLQKMADVSHDMETAVNQMASGQLATDLNQFGELHATLEQLQGLHDGVVRDFNIAIDSHATEEPASNSAAPFRSPMAPDAPLADQEPDAEPEESEAEAAPGAWDERLFWTPERDDAISALRRETARVAVEALDSMLNQAGEISIYRSRLEQQNSAIQFQLDEMAQTINRVRDQLRQLDAETDAQIEARGLTAAERAEQGEDRYGEDFDPLEMDRYSRMQELSRALSESVNDLSSLHATMDGVMDESEALILQQGRVNTEVQQGLMRTLMVPFSRQVQRLQRVVRQVAEESVKKVQVQFSGVEAELDRNVLERMTAPLEHLLRNAVVHGIELPAQRVQTGKPEQGTIKVELFREGTQLVIELSDDGSGLNIDAIRAKAVERGLMPEDADVDDRAIAQFIFEPGFSTASELTQSAGRGVGMDVVAAEVKQLGGTLELGSERGQGTRFVIRLPLTLAISQALLIGVGVETYAVSLSSIEGIARIPTVEVDAFLKNPERQYDYGGQEYQVHYLGDFLSLDRPEETEARTLPAILVKVGEGLGGEERHIAVVVDALFGNREVVSKAVGPQVSSILGVSGATILADGRVVLILDVPALVQDRTRRELLAEAGKAERVKVESDDRETVMVVDDSITMRRVAERLLSRNGYKVITAKDGLDAIAQLQTESPQVILLDIEMPRADGFEVATFIRNTDRIAKTPIIMITSRSGDKHRERAAEIGVNRYLIKPYQEEQLMNEVRSVTAEA